MSRPRTPLARARKRLRRVAWKIHEARVAYYSAALRDFLRGDGDPNKRPVGIANASRSLEP